MSESFSLEKLKAAVSGNAAAIRLINRLQPAGGPGSKVFPPTHSGGVYAWEMRRIGNEVVLTVLLDSVQSQANRMEQALLEAHRANKLQFPLLQVDFSNDFPDIGIITTLDAPHRIADAIFRDSLVNGTRFRDSNIGQAFVHANIRNASALLQYCPHALVFGVWDSTGSKGGLGVCAAEKNFLPLKRKRV
jgi:CRISPR-associated protein Csb1